LFLSFSQANLKPKSDLGTCENSASAPVIYATLMSHYVYLSQSAKSTFIYNYKKYLLQRAL